MKRKIMIFFFISTLILLLTILIGNKQETIRLSFSGEGELWIIESSLEGHYKFYENDDKQLDFSGAASKDIRLIYKGDLTDLNEFETVGIVLMSCKSSRSSDGGFTAEDLYFKASFGIVDLMRIEEDEHIEMVICWNDGEDHEETVELTKSN